MLSLWGVALASVLAGCDKSLYGSTTTLQESRLTGTINGTVYTTRDHDRAPIGVATDTDLPIVCYDQHRNVFGVAVLEATGTDGFKYWTTELVEGGTQPVGFVARGDVVAGEQLMIDQSCDNSRVIHEVAPRTGTVG